MKTAVDYIKEKLMCNEYWYENMTFDQIIDQAKEMEKEFLILAHINGQSEFDKGFYRQEVINNAEQYYKETFK